MLSPRRVPPLQSGTCAEARCNALSGFLLASSFVRRVRRVPNAKASTRCRPTTAACMKRNSARAYGSMLPEMSSSTTRRRCFSPGSRHNSWMGSPPWVIDARTVLRKSWREPRLRELRNRKEVRGGPASRSCCIKRCDSCNSSSLYSAKSFSLSVSVAEKRRVSVGLSSTASGALSTPSSSSSMSKVIFCGGSVSGTWPAWRCSQNTAKARSNTP